MPGRWGAASLVMVVSEIAGSVVMMVDGIEVAGADLVAGAAEDQNGIVAVDEGSVIASCFTVVSDEHKNYEQW